MINDLKKLYSHLRLSGEVRQARKVAGIINRYAQQTDQPEEVSPLLSPWERGLEEPYTWTEGQKKVYNLIKGLDLTGTPRELTNSDLSCTGIDGKEYTSKDSATAQAGWKMLSALLPSEFRVTSGYRGESCQKRLIREFYVAEKWLPKEVKKESFTRRKLRGPWARPLKGWASYSDMSILFRLSGKARLDKLVDMSNERGEATGLYIDYVKRGRELGALDTQVGLMLKGDDKFSPEDIELKSVPNPGTNGWKDTTIYVSSKYEHEQLKVRLDAELARDWDSELYCPDGNCAGGAGSPGSTSHSAGDTIDIGCSEAGKNRLMMLSNMFVAGSPYHEPLLTSSVEISPFSASGPCGKDSAFDDEAYGDGRSFYEMCDRPHFHISFGSASFSQEALSKVLRKYEIIDRLPHLPEEYAKSSEGSGDTGEPGDLVTVEPPSHGEDCSESNGCPYLNADLNSIGGPTAWIRWVTSMAGHTIAPGEWWIGSSERGWLGEAGALLKEQGLEEE